MAEPARHWFDRAVEAEAQLESLRERTADLESRLRAVLVNDPASATRALAWMGRARNAESLLVALASWVQENPSVEELLPRGYMQRLKAQLHSVAVLKRDEEAFDERQPADDEFWLNWDGVPGIAIGDNPTPARRQD